MNQNLGCCCQACSRDIPAYTNTTVVPNYDLTTGGDISPYSRPDAFAISSGCIGDSCGGTDEKPCGAWPYADWAAFSETASGSTVSKNFCYGHKVPGAFKIWQGVPDQNYCYGTIDPCESISTLYRSVEVDIVRKEWDPVFDGSGYYTGSTISYQVHQHFKVTVAKESGIKTLSDCSRTVVLPDGSTWDGVSGDWSEATTDAKFDHMDVVRRRCASYQQTTEWVGSWGSVMAASGNTAETNGGTLASPYVTDDGSVKVEYGEEHTATSFTISRKQYVYEPDSPTTQTLMLQDESTIQVTLSDAYSLADLIADTNTLLNEWPLNDDTVTAWRTDGYCALGQLVVRREKQASPDDITPTAPDYCAWTDPDADEYDGSVWGAPLGHLGLDFGFGWQHKNYVWCGSTWQVAYYGARSNSMTYEPTDACMSGNVTNWTEQPDVAANLNGAWIRVDTDGCLIQKAVEAKVGLSCVNFSWPSGVARYLMDQEKAVCINFWTGNVATVTSDPTSLLSVGDPVVCYDGDNASKAGTITAIDASTITVDFDASIPTSYVDDARNLWWPADYVDFTLGGAGGTIGLQRWAADYRGAIVTPVSITDAVQVGSDIKLTLGSAKYLIATDHIDVTGVSGLGTDETVSSVSGNDVTIAGKTLGAAYTGGGTVVSHGAPAAVWDSTASRGDFVVQSYPQGTGASCGTIDATPSESQETLNRVTAPLAITPSGETWAASYYATDLTSPSCTASGGMTAKLIVQAVTHPYFQQPLAALGVTLTCPPKVEARIGTSVPSGAPAFPAGISYESGAVYAAGHSAGAIYAHDVAWAVCTE